LVYGVTQQQISSNGQVAVKKRLKISLCNMTDNQKRAVLGFYSLKKTFVDANRFDELHSKCRGLLHKINKQIWPRRKTNITLNTGYQDWSRDYKHLNMYPSIKQLMDTVKDNSRYINSKDSSTSDS
jgi:hypothetical protein